MKSLTEISFRSKSMITHYEISSHLIRDNKHDISSANLVETKTKHEISYANCVAKSINSNKEISYESYAAKKKHIS